MQIVYFYKYTCYIDVLYIYYFSLLLLFFIRSISRETYVYMFPQNLLQHLLQHFVASIALTLYLCYTTSTSNFGHDIFIMFQRPWKSPARISFLNFIAFSAKNSLRFLMMLLIHRNFKCPCTCTSCMHTGQKLRYFWISDKSLLYRIYFHSISILSFYTYNVKIYSESF